MPPSICIQLLYKHSNYLIIFSCQFVVKGDGDYKLNLLDPDVPIKWDQIEEVVSLYYTYQKIMLVHQVTGQTINVVTSWFMESCIMEVIKNMTQNAKTLLSCNLIPRYD